MTRERGDESIRAGFEALRADAEGAGRVPDFEAMMARAKADSAGTEAAPAFVRALPHRRALRVGGWMSLAAAAAAVGLLLIDGPAVDPDAEFERLVASYATSTVVGSWRSPTSGLLDLPGLDLGSVPTIGGGLDGVDRTRLPEARVPNGRDS